MLPVLNGMDGIWRSMKHGNAGELHFDDADVLPEAPSFYGKRNCYYGASFPGRNEIDGTQELNYRPICEAIVATGFKGFLAQEFIPRRDPMTSLREAIDTCDV